MNNSAALLATFLQKELNEHQRAAVEQPTGPLLIIAGAGSGKTRVITARIAHLMLSGHTAAHELIALTFTNKAAKEMLERVSHFLGDAAPSQLPFIGTFHGYCIRLLKRYHHLLEHPFLAILDEDDQQKIIAALIQRYGLSKRTTAKQLIYQLSQVKNRCLDRHELEYELRNNLMLMQVYQAYETEKRLSKCLDFDDILLHTLALLRKNPPLLASLRIQIRHVLIDEYQDTNLVQHALIKQIVLDDKKLITDSVCVVGDDDQSIYSWRGATITNMVNFSHDFANTRIIKIEQNYRSVQPILTAANALVTHNTQRNPKALWSNKLGNDRIRIITCLTDRQEGELVAQCLQHAYSSKKIGTSAVLYRAHFQSRTIEEALIKRSIPYKIIGGIQFYERKEIKDILAYVRLVINPFDRTSLYRVLNCPTRGLGAQCEETLREQWTLEPFLSFHELIKSIIAQGMITGVRSEALTHFSAIFASLSHDAKPYTTIEQLIAITGYYAYLQKSYDREEAQERVNNIKELLRAVQQFEAQGIVSLNALLDEITLMQELSTQEDDEQTNNPVMLMTLHAAKGLEFDLVVMSGLEEGIMPSSRALTSTESLEEERRLAYVGITRAREYLLLSHSRYRYTYGQTSEQLRSRFVQELPPHVTLIQDCSHMNSYQATIWFDQWLGTHVRAEQATAATMPARIPTASARQHEPARQTLAHDLRLTNSISNEILEMVPREKIFPAESSWKKNQTVQHPTLGVGVIKSVEDRGSGTTVAQVQFKTGTKKIVTSFLTKI